MIHPTMVSARWCIAALAALLALGSSIASAAPAPARVAASAPADDGLITLNLPPAVELKVLIEYVSKRLGINIIYDEAVGSTRVAILSPNRIQKDELLDLLRRALKMANLELVDGPDAAWKTIGRKVGVRFLTVKNVNAVDLAKRASSVLDEKERIVGAARSAAPRIASARGPAAPTMLASSGGDVTLVPDAKSNQITIVALETEMAATLALIESLDVSAELETRTYHFKHINPKRIDTLMRSRVTTEVPEPTYASTIDEPSGLLIVTARGSVQKMVELLGKELDIEADPNRSNIQFYKLVNATAADVLQTIRTLQGGSAATAAKALAGASADMIASGPYLPANAPTYVVPNVPSSPGLAPLPAPPSYHESATSQPAEGGASGTVTSALGQNAIISADTNTNTIIVVAPPEVQRMYKQLIAVLDKRRPQVLIEVTLVTLDTSNGCSIGVELGKTKITKDNKVIVFNSFGLTERDPDTGLPTLIPNSGFNGVLLSPESLDVVVQALATDAHSSILAAPKILMNDNATGTLSSVNEAPTTSVNASATVSTTSFSGYASAGTTVTVTPHISEGDYLQLKYSVTLSSFTSPTDDSSVPPPRQTDTVNSEITIPNGSAVIVGGLTRKDSTHTESKVPLIGDVPIVKYLFSAQKNTDSKTTLFVFIRPIILRDDKFEDLKGLSDTDLAAAKLPPNFPPSLPIVFK